MLYCCNEYTIDIVPQSMIPFETISTLRASVIIQFSWAINSYILP